MIKIEKHRLFKKYYQKLNARQKKTFAEYLSSFRKDPYNPIFRLHHLKGDLKGYYAFSVGGDLRVIFQWIDKNKILLVKIGSHNQVY